MESSDEEATSLQGKQSFQFNFPHTVGKNNETFTIVECYLIEQTTVWVLIEFTTLSRRFQ